jgi:hypothetical protein
MSIRKSDRRVACDRDRAVDEFLGVAMPAEPTAPWS